MILFSTQTSSRLQYMADWLGKSLFNQSLLIVTNENQIPDGEWAINYSSVPLRGSVLQITPHWLLFETGVRNQAIHVRVHEDLPYFFETSGKFHFDILAASFYLLQRYEEYLVHDKDIHGRFAHQNSLAFREKFLHLPLVDLWLLQLKAKMVSETPAMEQSFYQHSYRFVPTYDVDIAFSYKGKGIWRNFGGWLKSLGNPGSATERWQVLKGKRQDPFDIFNELEELHIQFGLTPVFFFLVAAQQKGFDKNISPTQPVYRQLINSIGKRHLTGIHPGAAASADSNLMLGEKRCLEGILGRPVFASRMHYLLFSLPDTFNIVHRQPFLITEEYSMGYGSINGFRSSTSRSYGWYDLTTETAIGLTIFPFCYMDANSIFEQKDSTEQALEEMKRLSQIVQKTGGNFTCIFHNHLLGRDPKGRKWMQVHKDFLADHAASAPA